jgi:diaminohydroxyphosphoribosylaminopyrimidine deaminase/5-amino-6-(5-phosphoribosylamino)uracil reductase
LWSGKNPVRLVIDKDLKLAENSRVFNNEASTIVFNIHKSTIQFGSALTNQVYYFKVEKNEGLAQQILNCCYKLNLQSILVEGGAKLLQSFINERFYDEIRIITNENLVVDDGLDAPTFSSKTKIHSEIINSDKIEFFL